MRTVRSRNRQDGPFRYYICSKAHAKDGCGHSKYHRADNAEGTVARIVSDLLGNPARIAGNMDAAIEAESQILRNPEESAKFWNNKLAEVAQERDRRLHQHAKGHIFDAELDAYLAELNSEKAEAEEKLQQVKGGQRRIDELRANRRAV